MTFVRCALQSREEADLLVQFLISMLAGPVSRSTLEPHRKAKPHSGYALIASNVLVWAATKCSFLPPDRTNEFIPRISYLRWDGLFTMCLMLERLATLALGSTPTSSSCTLRSSQFHPTWSRWSTLPFTYSAVRCLASASSYESNLSALFPLFLFFPLLPRSPVIALVPPPARRSRATVW